MSKTKKCTNCGQFDSGVIYPCKSTIGHLWPSELVPTIPEGPSMVENITIDQRYKFMQQIKMLRVVLIDVKAGLGDRLLAEGPLSKPYAHAVMEKIDGALEATRNT